MNDAFLAFLFATTVIVGTVFAISSCDETDSDRAACRRRGGEPVFIKYRGIVCFSPEALK